MAEKKVTKGAKTDTIPKTNQRQPTLANFFI